VSKTVDQAKQRKFRRRCRP